MFKSFTTQTNSDDLFIRNGLINNIRLDGRRPDEFRKSKIIVNRSESQSSCEVQWGDTRVFASVRGDIVIPYPDRPNEGILNFNADVSITAQQLGVSPTEISRVLEKLIRDTDTIDTESLCIVSGAKVWMIICDVKVLDYAGSAIDASILAGFAALQAFRKPEVSVVFGDDILNDIIVHSSDEREPLPLALHHIPLCITLGLFKGFMSASQEKVYLKTKTADFVINFIFEIIRRMLLL
jgi:exosome complex component RRP45